MKAAVFLDRDGVLVEDRGITGTRDGFEILPGVVDGLCLLKAAGYLLVTVSNQAVVARGLATVVDVVEGQRAIEAALVTRGAPRLDGFYFCPHHPHADDTAYRCICDCRKPNPGLIHAACRELEISPTASFMVGDRGSDITAGARAGCRTVWTRTGRHGDPPIIGADDTPIRSDHACDGLREAAAWIVGGAPP